MGYQLINGDSRDGEIPGIRDIGDTEMLRRTDATYLFILYWENFTDAYKKDGTENMENFFAYGDKKYSIYNKCRLYGNHSLFSLSSTSRLAGTFAQQVLCNLVLRPAFA